MRPGGRRGNCSNALVTISARPESSEVQSYVAGQGGWEGAFSDMREKTKAELRDTRFSSMAWLGAILK